MTDLTPAQVDLAQRAINVAKDLDATVNGGVGQRTSAETVKARLDLAVTTLNSIALAWTP
jgi:hypothetical protein